MEKIYFLIILLFLITSISAQHKTLTLYYPDDSTNVIGISDLDSMAIFICGVSKVSYGGKDYNTVLIGSQCWLKENLDMGTMVMGSSTQTNTGTIEKYCYNNLESNCTTYGGLYQWNEAMQYVTTEGTQGICPTGWHIPRQGEFQSLIAEVSGNSNALKEMGQGTGGGTGTNTSGFSALLAGYRYSSGAFYALGSYAYFWSSSMYNASTAYYLNLYYTNSNITLYHDYKVYGFSVRCIKD